MPESLDELDLLLLTVSTPRKVQRDGIHCHGLRYFSITLAAYVGEPVTVRYDPRDLAEIRVYHHDESLCRAVSPEIATVTVSMQDLQAARNQRRRFDRQLARYPQLYSRIGFAHQYKPLDVDDLPLVLTNYWDQLGFAPRSRRHQDFETVSAVVRITGGNFRLIERLMTQVARVMEINQLDALDPDVIHAARQMLVVG